MKKLMKKIKMNNKGFTLVELIVVIAVLAIITVVAAPQYLKYVEKSKIGTDENALGEIAHIAEIAYVEYKSTTSDTTIDTDVAITKSDDGKFVVTGTTGVDAYVKDIVGTYEIKSDKYLTETEYPITITITDGVAQCPWVD